MKSAFKKMNGIIERVWNDRVTITGVKNGLRKGFTEDVPVIICENRPGKVILRSLKTSNQTEFGTDQYDVKLLIDNDVSIPAGADISVTDVNGHVTKYKRSSKGYRGYVSHQEVAMIRDEKAKDVISDGMGND
ncbi:hypothetical protein [Companilactobacillus nantensis]|uniref:Phage protein n=1 Tax=Companilactobacillus nantensis DSM 16982 TaxID=1423774 RepID=A0A0R1WIB6_9LACO|nr:hypothetical protein [Companilactobacillus nantensis]KRM17487.1 hypothetical protein FD31_GL002680 [Companilactobacillus nantensis DSM 16982]GEO64462.1 hypothetical protein LNA01_16450 [Companilactobacillus nantensis]